MFEIVFGDFKEISIIFKLAVSKVFPGILQGQSQNSPYNHPADNLHHCLRLSYLVIRTRLPSSGRVARSYYGFALLTLRNYGGFDVTLPAIALKFSSCGSLDTNP